MTIVITAIITIIVVTTKNKINGKFIVTVKHGNKLTLFKETPKT